MFVSMFGVLANANKSVYDANCRYNVTASSNLRLSFSILVTGTNVVKKGHSLKLITRKNLLIYNI